MTELQKVHKVVSALSILTFFFATTRSRRRPKESMSWTCDALFLNHTVCNVLMDVHFVDMLQNRNARPRIICSIADIERVYVPEQKCSCPTACRGGSHTAPNFP